MIPRELIVATRKLYAAYADLGEHGIGVRLANCLERLRRLGAEDADLYPFCVGDRRDSRDEWKRVIRAAEHEPIMQMGEWN